MDEDELLQEEIVGEDPYVKTDFDDGSTEYNFDEEEINDILMEGVIDTNDDFYRNLAEDIEDEILHEIGADVIERFEDDVSSRSQWLDTVNSGLSLLGIEVEETDDPFPGACSAHHPLILESAVKFQAKASNELFSPKGSVKTVVMGKSTEEKESQAQRVRNHMNYQLMYQMEEYFDETENLLFYLPIVGSAFKKTYYDSNLDRPVSTFVPVDQFVVNYYASSVRSAPCFTHMIQRLKNDLKKDQKSGFYSDVEIAHSGTSKRGETEMVIDEITGVYANSDEEVYTLLEQYCYLDLVDNDPESDEDGIALPYVVTVEANTGTVLSIRRNWRENDPQQTMICPFTHYKFVPGLGFYGLGLIHLLGNLQITLTSAMRSLVDSGAFATLQGGFVDKRLRIRNIDGPLSPGEFREAEAGGMPLRDAIINIPFKEPSQVLLAMYQFIEERGQKFADSTEQVIADSTNYGPVGTTMALLEASGKFFSGVHKRLHKAQKHEFSLLASLNYEYLGESESFDIVGDTFEISKEDYDGRIDVVPVSDPNLGSQAQKLTLAQSLYTAALQKPEIHDIYEVSKYYYNAIGVDDDYIDKFLPKKEEATESDPLTDIIKAQEGKPIKAFHGQDHDSHIQILSAFLNDPQSGGSPAMAPVVPILQANIREHMIMKFKEAIVGTVEAGGNPEGMMEKALIAQAAQQVSQTNAKLQDLQAKGPDEARNKLADAEVQRAINETRRLEIDAEDKVVQRTYDALKIELERYSENNKLLIAEMQHNQKLQGDQLKNIADIITKSMEIKSKAESEVNKNTATNSNVGVPKEEPKE